MNTKPDGTEISQCVLGNGLGRPSGDVSYRALDRVMQCYSSLLQTLDEQHM